MVRVKKSPANFSPRGASVCIGAKTPQGTRGAQVPLSGHSYRDGLLCVARAGNGSARRQIARCRLILLSERSALDGGCPSGCFESDTVTAPSDSRAISPARGRARHRERETSPAHGSAISEGSCGQAPVTCASFQAWKGLLIDAAGCFLEKRCVYKGAQRPLCARAPHPNKNVSG